MSAWLRQHRRAFGQALRRLAKATGLASALVIGIALSLPAGGYTLLESLRAIAARLTLEPQISLFLQPEAKRAEAEALGKRLRADPRVATLRFVPREDALRELQAVEGFPELIAALGRNPLPDAFVLSTNAAAVDALAADLAKLPGVAHVLAESYGSSFRFAFLPAGDALAVVLFAGLLGWLGAHLSVSRHLRDIEPG